MEWEEKEPVKSNMDKHTNTMRSELLGPQLKHQESLLESQSAKQSPFPGAAGKFGGSIQATLEDGRIEALEREAQHVHNTKEMKTMHQLTLTLSRTLGEEDVRVDERGGEDE
ncbi:hypothetical protein JOB18_046069 [Solea senegalensis]|uniref:Uncharacterized protein n=1 Tax=Solea senegalensis TaxID=28829 RepID=A0AAV6QII3_SOLSE|nr:hypothetical protein JOB18_046069 [Solea senegalensis]